MVWTRTQRGYEEAVTLQRHNKREERLLVKLFRMLGILPETR